MTGWPALHEMADPSWRALGWTLVHALWQTSLAALAYSVWRAHTRRASVSLRHHLAAASLALSIVAAGATFWTLRWAPAPAQALAEPLVRPESSATTPPFRSALLAARRSSAEPSPDLLDPALVAFTVLWAGGVVLLGARMAGGLLLAGRIRRRAVPLASRDLLAAQSEMAARLELHRSVELLQSDEIDTPVALGWRRPAVLFPSELVRTGPEAHLVPLLAHELAHVRAGDYAANLLQTGFDALFFFCPGARFLSAEVRRLREYRCDDAAVALCDGRPPYARALAHLAGAHPPMITLPAPRATGPRLVDRLRRLAQGDSMPRPRPTWTLALALSMAAMGLGGFSLFPLSRLHAAEKTRPAAGAPGALPASLHAWTCPSPAQPRPDFTAAGLFRGNAFVPQDTPDKYFYCNPVLLDGRPVDWPAFSLKTKGTLTLVYGNPEAPDAIRRSFVVSLRRKGEIVEDPKRPFLNRPVQEVEIGDVLALAQPGDHLIIDPVDKADWRAKRVIELGGC